MTEQEYEYLPNEIKVIVDSWDDNKDLYKECTRIKAELEIVGWTCDYGLDGMVYDVMKIGSPKFTEEMLEWIEDGNVVQMGADSYIEQTTQWRKVFTKQELINFFIREYLEV
jgi:hypothetical protein